MKKREISTSTVTVTEEVIEDIEVEPLTDEEERVLRMRAGVTLPGDAPLGNKLDAVVSPLARADAAERIRLIEHMALEAIRERMEAAAARPMVNEARKARIISALKKKG